MLPDNRPIKCAICGKKSIQFCGFRSYNSHTFHYDFFGNPNINIGSQYCPHCGYANYSIDSIKSFSDDLELFQNEDVLKSKIKELIESESYKSCYNQKEFFNNKWEDHNYKSFLCNRLIGNYDRCAFILLHLIWHIDQRYLASYAKLNSEYGKGKNQIYNIYYDDEKRDLKELMDLTKELLVFVSKEFFKYSKYFIESNKDKDFSIHPLIMINKDSELINYVLLVINYIYYQRRFGDIIEVEDKLDLLERIKQNNEMKEWLLIKIEVLNRIERKNIEFIKDKCEATIINNAFGDYDREEIRLQNK